MYTVYMHISPNEKRYIGITSRKPESRWSNGNGYKNNQHFWNAICKYGWENFQHIIIARELTEEDAKWLEIELIREFNTTNQNNGYNLSLGGESWNCSEETKKKMSERNIRLGTFKGKNNPMYGKKGKDNPVSKQVIMFDLNGNIIKEFDCIKEANDYFNKNRALSHISKVCIHGGTAYNYLWLFKEDYDNLIKENKFNEWYLDTKNRYIDRNIKYEERKIKNSSKVVYQLNKDTLEIINKFDSIILASKSTNIKAQSISRVCKHGCNTAGGYSWIYKEEYEKISKEELEELYKHKYIKPPKECYRKNKKPIICLTTKRIFEGIIDAKEYYQMKNDNISACCTGKRKSVGKLPNGTKLVWRYLVWNHGRTYRIKKINN